MATKFETSRDELLLTIANNNVRSIETLETRNSDSLDFHDVSVAVLKTMLITAFEAGRSVGRTEGK